MAHFTQDNTAGFDAAEIDQMNREFDAALAPAMAHYREHLAKTGLAAEQVAKSVAERILRDHGAA